VTDQDTILKAFADLQRIAAAYNKPTASIPAWRRANVRRDHEVTIRKMIEIIDNEQVAAAAERLSKGYGLRVVK
jgi:hypothetical protein